MCRKITKCEGYLGRRYMTQKDLDRLREEGGKALRRINRSIQRAARIERFKINVRRLFGKNK